MILEQICRESRRRDISHLIKKGQQQIITILELRDKKVREKKADNTTYLQVPYQTTNQEDQKLVQLVQDVRKTVEDDVDVHLRPMLAIGEKFPSFGKVYRFNGKGAFQLKPKEGEVMIIHLWAVQNEESVDLLDQSADMVKRNKWGNKVKIFGINMDRRIRQVKQFINVKRWWYICEHLTIGGWDENHQLIKLLSITQIPFVCIVDTRGFIHSFTAQDIENNIKQILDSGTQKKVKKQSQQEQWQLSLPQKQFITSEQVRNAYQVLTDQETFMQKFGHKSFFATKIVSNSNLIERRIHYTVSIELFVYEHDKDLFRLYKELIPVQGIKIIKTVVPTVKVPEIPLHCTQCKKKLKYPLYWCYWEKDNKDFRCRACVEKKESKKKYSYQNNSILLVKETVLIEKQNLGENCQPKIIEDVTKPHSYICRYCKKKPKQIGQARYVCLSCNTEPTVDGRIDLCYECCVKYLEEDQKSQKKLTRTHFKCHPFVRVLYHVNGILEY